METAVPKNPVAALRDTLELKVEEMAEQLDCSKGHVSDLCTGRRPVTPPIARRLEALSGKPWHEWMPEPEDET